MFGVKDKGETSRLIDTCIREFLVSDKATDNYRPSSSSNPVMALALQISHDFGSCRLNFSSKDERSLLYIILQKICGDLINILRVILEKSPINGSL